MRQIDRKQNDRFDVYSDFYFVGMPEDNASAMPMLSKDSVGWKQTKGAWASEVPPPDKTYLCRSKVTACTPLATPQPMTM